MARSKFVPDVADASPDVKRVTLLNRGNVVGYGVVFGDGFTQLNLIGGWGTCPLATINDSSLSQALTLAWNHYPALDWEWTCADA